MGVVADNGANGGMAGQDTYLVNASDWFAWDGARPDHAAHFCSPKLAMEAALSCPGPLFRMPDPESIHVIERKEVS